MKLLLVFLGLMLSTAAFASDVKITSFKFMDHSAHFSPGAELCGEVISPTGKPAMIKVTSDPEEKAPGNYYVWSGPDGKFCAVIATYSGKADAELVK